MEKKGLCSTCLHEKYCTFPRRFPVLQCDEFDGFESSPIKEKDKDIKCEEN